MKFQFNAPWHELKMVCLGSTYPESFFRDVKNVKVRDLLQKIARETCDDFDNIEKILSGLGVDVIRPKLDTSDTIINHVDHECRLTFEKTGTYSLIPKPPMQPRDCQLIVGDYFWATNRDINLYKNHGIDFFPDCIILDEKQFDAPLITVIGQHLIVDQQEFPWLGKSIQQKFPDRTIVPVEIGGHNDAVFAPIKPGLLISSHYKNCYRDSFPNWEVYHLPDQSWNAMVDWRKAKHTNKNKWWVPDAHDNVDFYNFVDTWISHWLGHAGETVFDVNLLVVNENCILVNNYHKELFDFLKKQKIEPVIAPFRHRFFWDGGIHCITSDLYREGTAENYLE